MGRKRIKEENKMIPISASFHPNDVERIDSYEDEVVSRSDSRSKKLQHFVNLASPEGFDRLKLEYFENAIQAQIGKREIWHALTRSSVQTFHFQLKFYPTIWWEIILFFSRFSDSFQATHR